MASSESSSRGINMSPDTARMLFDNGGILVVLNLPIGSVFGIDMKVFNTGEKFRGVKMIPPGLHFIYYSTVSRDGTTGPRTGFFHYFGQKEIVIKKWNKEQEELSSESMCGDEVERVRNRLQELDPYLGTYPYDALKNWNRLTCNINEALLKRLEPESGIVSSVTQFIPLSFPPKPSDMDAESSSARSHQTLEEKYLPNMKQMPGTEIRFTKIPDVKYPPGSTAAEITKHSMDSTYTLELLLRTYDHDEDILGELQLALVCFLIAHVYEAFEHWKRLLEVFCFADSGLEKHAELLKTFLILLHYQIKEIPTDFFMDITSSNNFLVNTLHIFFDNVQNSNAPEEFKKFVNDFRKNLTKVYKWDFEAIPDDEMPVVVDI